MTWEEVFREIKTKDYALKLSSFLDEEYQKHTIYPERKNMFNAFKLTPLENVKVVIFGQDPYHEPGQAMGLAFSVPDNIKTPPSLINIYKEIEIEYNTVIFNKGGDLTYLAKQGVLLLNTILTVREHLPMSHNIKEYNLFMQDILDVLNKVDQPIVFLLWGGAAKGLEKYLTNKNHLILKATHPSPLGANQGGWFNSNIFLKTNEFLEKNGVKPINWVK
ncbi:MAG: uracil-DNA glycosylase [Bacilli bacterium]|nr:uracil-DNA glycosylase [Bacilli bacterium]